LYYDPLYSDQEWELIEQQDNPQDVEERLSCSLRFQEIVLWVVTDAIHTNQNLYDCSASFRLCSV